MLREEFVSAAEGLFPVKWDRLNEDAWEAITRLYISPELDEVCTGLDRHVKFARWLNLHQERLQAEFWYVSAKNDIERTQREIVNAIHEIRELRRRKEEQEAVFGLMRFFRFLLSEGG